MKGKFSLKHLATGGGSEAWYKSWGFGWRWTVTIAFLLFLVLGVRSCFQDPGNINKPHVIALPFSTVGDVSQDSEQKVEQKRKWWQPIPYLSVAAEARYQEEIQTGFKSEVGLRWDI